MRAEAARELHLRLRLPLNTTQFIYAQFYRPWDMAVNAQGQVYVADSGNNRIQKFDADRHPSRHLGQPGERRRAVPTSYGVAVDGQGNVLWRTAVITASRSSTPTASFNSPGAVKAAATGSSKVPLAWRWMAGVRLRGGHLQ